MKIPNGVVSFLITVGCYGLFFLNAVRSGGDESNNPEMAMAAFVAMTFFINFPLAWFLMNKIVKEIRSKREQK